MQKVILQKFGAYVLDSIRKKLMLFIHLQNTVDTKDITSDSLREFSDIQVNNKCINWSNQ